MAKRKAKRKAPKRKAAKKKGSAKKKVATIGSDWVTKYRMVDGKRRKVWVRKRAGRYQVRLTDPSKKKAAKKSKAKKATKRKAPKRKAKKKASRSKKRR